MPLVNVMVNSRAYTIACDDGEEDHLRELAAHVDSKVRELLESVGQVGDQRLLLMAAVLITDELFEARARQDAHAKKAGDLASAHDEISGKLTRSESTARESLESAAKRIEALTAKLNAA
ncbi:MAG TPA: cell division protein ZapA [Rhizomicrobium sp.]|jgi:cell division protein ZapA|nr:cell division protein ZapA [Rhizomicrobium sp.]